MLGVPAIPPPGPGLGEACWVEASFAPTSGSEGQMKESGCARGCRVGVMMIPESFYLLQSHQQGVDQVISQL